MKNLCNLILIKNYVEFLFNIFLNIILQTSFLFESYSIAYDENELITI